MPIGKSAFQSATAGLAAASGYARFMSRGNFNFEVAALFR